MARAPGNFQGHWNKRMQRRTFLQVAAAATSRLGRAAQSEPRLRLIRQHEKPVLTKRHTDARGNKYGFEGGRVVKVDSTYHLFTSEMVGDPIWVKMKFGHWSSPDGLQWKRVSTLYESSGEFQGKDPRAAL